jgi:hypothetical protein
VTQQEFFERVLLTLESLDIPYMVTGSVGAMLYGEPRLTNDMDVVVVLAPRHVQPLIAAFGEPAFYVPSSDVILDAIRERGQFNVIHIDSGSKVDLILRKETDFALAEFARRQRVVFTERLESQSATPEDIILAKLLYFREGQSGKHLEDIAGMLRVRGDQLDRPYLEQWVARLGLGGEWELARQRRASGPQDGK